MVVEGEAGMGKTTFLWNVAEAAAAEGFRVLSTAGALTEARYAYAAVADLLDTVDTAVLADLPAVQRTALERVLLLAGDGPPTNERTVAAAFLSVLQLLGVEAPVLVIIDDTQWLDTSSQVVFGYAARRLTGRVGVLASVRTGESRSGEPPSWLRMARPDSMARVKVQPLTLGGVHSLISKHLGHTLPRPLITRIHEVSGGNPFFALELARSVADEPSRGVIDLPDSLAVLVRQRIGRPNDELSAVLLAASCAALPTVERVSRAIDLTVDRVVEVVESVEASGVVELEGNKVRFCHPLFASGVYTGASPPQRRAMHRKLADTVEEPELRARHLALAATTGDSAMLEALDKAADVTAAQGAPAVAAELLELAIKLGGDSTVRRIRAAELHFRSGALGQARTRLQSTIDQLPTTSSLRCIALMLLAAVTGHDESMVTAVAALTQAVEAADDPALKLQARLLLAPGVGLTGNMKACVDHARIAVAEAERLGVDGTLEPGSGHLGAGQLHVRARSSTSHLCRRRWIWRIADTAAAATFRASAVAAVVSGWAGQLDSARDADTQGAAAPVAERYRDRHRLGRQRGGDDGHLPRPVRRCRRDGRGCRAAGRTDGRQEPTDPPVGVSVENCGLHRSCESKLATAARSAIDTAVSTGSLFLVGTPTTSLGFLEVSLGNYAAAIAHLEPLLAEFDPAHGTEMLTGGYLPDAVEALTALGRVDEAEPLVAALERNGAHHDRPWMLAVGARSRSHLLAARGELDAAEQAALEAMSQHRRLPMPFERARTQLLLGQLQRRRRRKQAAEATLREALETFERLGTPLWAKRAEVEIERLNVPVADGIGLTAAERRVAELAAGGRSNKEIAAELFIAPKTVEMNLSSVYRKLGIRSRAGLSAALGNYRGKP